MKKVEMFNTIGNNNFIKFFIKIFIKQENWSPKPQKQSLLNIEQKFV